MSYYATPACDGDAWWINRNDAGSRGDNDSPPNWQRAVTNNRYGQGMEKFIFCAVKQPDDHGAMIHCPGTYNPSSQKCDIELKCTFPYSWLNICPSPVINTSFFPTGIGKIDPSPTICAPAVTVDAPVIDSGFMDCGTNTYPLQTSASGIPAEHRYRALDFGAIKSTGQHVQIRSGAPDGATITSSQLNIRNAGIQAGYISTQSHFIAPGTSCTETELGKMAQQQYTNSWTATQMQCTYNRAFCGGTGYCYIPIKSPGILYNYSVARQTGNCPAGTIVAAQPAGGIDKNQTCPVESGLTIIEKVHGETSGCYSVIANLSFCSTYQTLCTYSDKSGIIQKLPIAALKQLQCSSAASTFTIDNYRQQ
jgi:hypothetical protein